WRCAMPARRQRLAAALAIGAGYVVGQLGLFGRPAFPPVEAWQWLLPLAVIATVLGVIDALGAGPLWVRRGLAWLLLGVTPWLLIKVLLPAEWSAVRTAATLAGLALGSIVIWTCLHALATRWSGPL